jgi:hypothetical protein
MKTNEFYPVHDPLPTKILESLGLHRDGPRIRDAQGEKVWADDIKAMPTGEFRCPKEGEWYLSGAIVEAYRAGSDLSSPYYIAQIVLTETVKVTKVIGQAV